jgi:hypothetical protein
MAIAPSVWCHAAELYLSAGDLVAGDPANRVCNEAIKPHFSLGWKGK